MPEGGIACRASTSRKVADKDPVRPGETFNYTISVTNPYDCTLTNVRVVDAVSAPDGITFTDRYARPARRRDRRPTP